MEFPHVLGPIQLLTVESEAGPDGNMLRPLHFLALLLPVLGLDFPVCKVGSETYPQGGHMEVGSHF